MLFFWWVDLVELKSNSQGKKVCSELSLKDYFIFIILLSKIAALQ